MLNLNNLLQKTMHLKGLGLSRMFSYLSCNGLSYPKPQWISLFCQSTLHFDLRLMSPTYHHEIARDSLACISHTYGDSADCY